MKAFLNFHSYLLGLSPNYILSISEIFYYDVMTEVSTRFWISCTINHPKFEKKFQMSKIWRFFIDLWRDGWRSMLDIFDIPSIPETFRDTILGARLKAVKL